MQVVENQFSLFFVLNVKRLANRLKREICTTIHLIYDPICELLFHHPLWVAVIYFKNLLIKKKYSNYSNKLRSTLRERVQVSRRVLPFSVVFKNKNVLLVTYTSRKNMKNGEEGKPHSHNKSSVDDYFPNILKCLLKHVGYSSETQLQS